MNKSDDARIVSLVEPGTLADEGKEARVIPTAEKSTDRVLRAGAQEKVEVAQGGALGTAALDARSV